MSSESFRVQTELLPELSEEEKIKLKKQDSRLVSVFQANKLELEAQKFWDQFYKRNKTNFFKDRHWTFRELQELPNLNGFDKQLKILELGCGVGNLIFPLFKAYPKLEIFACDFSPRAVEFVKNNDMYDSRKIKVFQADITKDDLLENTKESVDLVTGVFVLSAIHPNNFSSTIKNIYRVLKPGGTIFIRDYAVNDMTQIRFKPGHKISENFYMRQDGTRSYFFTTEELKKLFYNESFKEIKCYYVKSRTINKKKDINVPRTFIQAEFIKMLHS